MASRVSKRHIFAAAGMFAIVITLVLFLVNTDTGRNSGRVRNVCDVMVIGGGIGGVYTAYRINQAKPDKKVCLIEATNRFGGRLKTITLDNGEKFDVGGVRFNEEHTLMKKLASDLGIEAEAASYLSLGDAPLSEVNVMMVSRGVIANNTIDLKERAYPSVRAMKSGWDVILDRETEYYKNSPLEDTFSFIQRGLGSAEEMSYFLSTFRFQGDFQGVDRKTYSVFAEHDTVNHINYYPKEGMQAFVDKMMKKLNENVHIIHSRAVSSVSWCNERNGKICVFVGESFVMADQLVFAVPPQSVSEMSGSIARELASHIMIKQSRPVPASVVTMRFEHAWWESASSARRIWTDSNCIQLIEHPITEERKKSKAFRAVYADGRCALEWAQIYSVGGTELVKKTVLNYMIDIYPGVEIPQPLETHVEIWDISWHFESPGAPYSMTDKEQWAIKPLIYTDKISFVGEAFNMKRTWAEGALQSCENILSKYTQ